MSGATVNSDQADGALELLGLGMDDSGLVFREGDRVYRAIYPGQEEFFEELLAHAAIQELMADGSLLPTKRSDRRIEGHSLVLEQPHLPLVTYPFEWAASMFKTAALSLLHINLTLMKHGFCTKDGHLWNFIFEGAKPRFVDFTSLGRFSPKVGWRGDGEFESCCLGTLMLMEKGYATEARALLRDIRANPDPALARAVLVNTKRYKHLGLKGDLKKAASVAGYFGRKLIRRIHHQIKPRQWLPGIAKLNEWREQIEAMDIQPTQEMWSAYYGQGEVLAYRGTIADIEALRTATPKNVTIMKLLKQINPASVLDLACNRGLYSQFAALEGARVVGVDTDEQALDIMYGDVARLGTTVQPLFLNAICPAEAVSFRFRPLPSVVERLRSECVFCLALTHHLVFRQPHLKFPEIARLLAEFSSRHLIVEFIPLTDLSLQETLAKHSTGPHRSTEWYNIDAYEAAFRAHFAGVERHESHPTGRVILFCRDKLA